MSKGGRYLRGGKEDEAPGGTFRARLRNVVWCGGRSSSLF